MFDGKDTIVLFDELAYEDVLSVAWTQRAPGFGTAQAERLAERNLRLLQACDALDESVLIEKADESSAHLGDLARLDFKINLLLDLVGRLLAQSHARPAAVPVRFNALGASWQPAGPSPATGEAGLLQIYLRDTLVEPLALAAEIVSVAPSGLVRARFELLGETVADHLERLVFRRHRRKIAGTRVPRRS